MKLVSGSGGEAPPNLIFSTSHVAPPSWNPSDALEPSLENRILETPVVYWGLWGPGEARGVEKCGIHGGDGYPQTPPRGAGFKCGQKRSYRSRSKCFSSCFPERPPKGEFEVELPKAGDGQLSQEGWGPVARARRLSSVLRTSHPGAHLCCPPGLALASGSQDPGGSPAVL